jgi:hypothetical protein
MCCGHFVRVVSGYSPRHCCALLHAQNEIAPSASVAKALFPFQMAALP